MTISALPTPPSRSDSPADFATKADAFLAALPAFGTQANALASDVKDDAAAAATQAGIAEAQAGIAAIHAENANTSATSAASSASSASLSATTAAGHEYAAAVSASAASAFTDNAGASAAAAASSAQTALDAAASIADGPVTSVNGKTGVVVLTPSDIGAQTVYLSGDTNIYITQSKAFTITNYNVFSDYVVQVSAGGVSMTGDTINFTAPAAAQTVTLTVNMDGSASVFSLVVQPAAVAPPTIVSPIGGAIDITETPTITSSDFAVIGGSDIHIDSDWEIRTAPSGGGTLVASSLASATNKTSWTVSAGLLSVSTTYYVRVRHRGTTMGASAWGESSFTTAATFNNYIPTPAATPANFGDALEGGFYAGMIWGQITQSSSSKTLATGTQSFAVPDMTSAPIVYAGQQIEVRSRANPANKFIGTVTGAKGSTLTLNVSSIGGSGTFSDWSVMARYRVIVAPKSSGEHSGIALKSSNDAFPSACRTLTEGFASTQAMKDAGTSSVYPAAHWCRALNIGGRTDWYIPARDELELCWRNLKPVTNSNYASADRVTDASFSYANNGSYGDTANTHGTNNNSSPTGSAYTASVPEQTAVTAFRSGGTEAFEFGSSVYWSSSEYSASFAWCLFWFSSFPGRQDGNGKASTYRVRAVRRSVI